jgi:hypothetical protein
VFAALIHRFEGEHSGDSK